MKYKQKDKINKVISSILRECTGTHFLDSGSAYGRNWEKNQQTNFEKTEPVKVDAWKECANITLNVYHYLTAFLEITKESYKMNKVFQRYINLPENGDKHYLELMEGFIESLEKVEGYCGITNTYNYDNILSQVLQYALFGCKGEQFIILQTHNGCDVRGGYSQPTIFRLCDREYFIMAQRNINASDGENNWYSDDAGYHWYFGYSSNGQTALGREYNPELGKVVILDEANNQVISKLTNKPVKYYASLDY